MLIEAIQSLKSKLHQGLNNSDRRAKIQDADFVVGLLQAASGMNGNFTLADIRLQLCAILGWTIGCSAFNERLCTPSLVSHLRQLVGILIDELRSQQPDRFQAQLLDQLGVKSIVGVDASVVTLWDGLLDHFGGTFAHAALKLHAAVDLVAGGISWFDLTPAKVHDSKRFPVMDPGCLYIIDLGYWSIELHNAIALAGSFFLSRVKGNSKMVVTQVAYGIGKAIVGHDLLSYPILNKRSKVIDLRVAMNVAGQIVERRVVGVWNKKIRAYHWYLTNLDVAAKLIYDLYRLRWQVELSFKSMKSTLNFDRMPTTNPNAATSLALVALCNFLLAMLVRHEAARASKQALRAPSLQKASKIFRAVANQLLGAIRIGKYLTTTLISNIEATMDRLLRTAFDPNHRKRKTTLERLQAATTGS
jgi:hypothetical protein